MMHMWSQRVSVKIFINKLTVNLILHAASPISLAVLMPTEGTCQN